MKIVLYSRFDRDYERLIKKQPLIASRVHKTVRLLSTNPGHPSLRIHKLVGRDNYSISVTMSIRLFSFVKVI